MKTTNKQQGINYYDLMVYSPDESPDTRIGTYRTEKQAELMRLVKANEYGFKVEDTYVESHVLVFDE